MARTVSEPLGHALARPRRVDKNCVIVGRAVDPARHEYTLGFCPQPGGYAYVEPEAAPGSELHREPAGTPAEAVEKLRAWTATLGWTASFLL